MISIKDFKQGKTAFLLILKKGNVGRTIHSDYIRDYIKEVTVTSAKTKNVCVDYGYHRLTFSYKEQMLGFTQNTSGCIDYMLFPSINDIFEYLEREQLIEKIRKYFSIGYGTSYPEITLEKARAIMSIIQS